MDEILKEYGFKALQWLESSAAWISGEIPVYIEEIIKWNMAESIVYMIVAFLFFAVGIIGPFVVKKIIDKNDYDEFANMFSLFFMAPLFIGFFVGIDYMMKAIQISVAPRVYLIEYLSRVLQ